GNDSLPPVPLQQGENTKAWFPRPLDHSLTGRGRGTHKARPREIFDQIITWLQGPTLHLMK
ncbi:unnamed protein product, partial [Prunus brigantina]